MNRTRYILIPLLIFIAISHGCGLSASKDGLTLPATDVGTPQGEKVSKEIGPAGGSIDSPDGKLTLTVPQNALTETVSFSIQPVTNKAENGIGSGYRLEPSGKKFTTPLKISIHYDDNDLKGTGPAALTFAYQDEKGAWHSPTDFDLDEANKTIAISTTHFSDWVYLALLRIIPTEAAVYVGDTQFIKIGLACPPTKFFDWFFSIDCSEAVYTKSAEWELKGEGTLTRVDESSGVVYTAPARKPAKNPVWVELNIVIGSVNRRTGEVFRDLKTFATKITILDAGYRASGESHDAVYTGVVCDMNKPFEVNAAGLANFEFKFVPTSDASGKVNYKSSYMAGPVSVTESGSGTYKVTDSGDGFDVAVDLESVAHAGGRTFTPSGNTKIHFTPLPKTESPCVQ